MSATDQVERLKTMLTGAAASFLANPAGVRPHFSGIVASAISKLLEAHGASADQHQANGLYGVHQVRVRLPGDATVYRVIVCPADAPISIGGCPVDRHFIEPIHPTVGKAVS